MKIQRRFVDQALIEANLVDGEDGVNVRSDYSGRGMYGERCFGVDFDRKSESYAFLVALAFVMARHGGDCGEAEAIDLAEAAETDSMGRGMILYFPGYSLEG